MTPGEMKRGDRRATSAPDPQLALFRFTETALMLHVGRDLTPAPADDGTPTVFQNSRGGWEVLQ
jgi:hypothetical protein